MLAFIIKRLLTTIPTILLVTVVVFGILRITPGGPAVAMLGEQASPEAVAALRHKLGLDQPLYRQYLHWLGGALHGDLGRSAFGNQPVTELIVQRIMPTAELGFLALLISLLIGLTLGIVAAVRHNSLSDAISSFIAILGVSTPSFWLAILLVLIFAVKLHWLPALGYVSPLADPLTNLKQMILPSITLGVILAAVVTRFTRAAMLDALYQDYVRTARAKGAPESRVMRNHILRNALLPIVTMLGMDVAAALGGAIFTETVFGLNGLGYNAIQAIGNYDSPTVMGIIVFATTAIIVMNLIVDLLYAWIDPRIRLA